MSEGFDPILGLSQFTIDGAPILEFSRDLHYAITNAVVQRTINGPSTLTIMLTDPSRLLIRDYNTTRGYLLQPGLTVGVDGLKYTLMQFTKAADQVQLVFEAEAVYRLRQMRGVTANFGDLRGFFQSLIDECNAHYGSSYKLVASDIAYANLIYRDAPAGASQQPITASRGSTTDPGEDSWTAMLRTAGTIGWRCWESLGTIFLGPDEYWLGLQGDLTTYGAPPVNQLVNHWPIGQLEEFTRHVQYIDYDWDIGKPFGNATVTCMLDFLPYVPGEVVNLSLVGPGSGDWLVSTIQRDLFNSQGTIMLQVPVPSNSLINTSSLPVAGRPLTR